jgi:hypothetical protein
MLDRFLSIVMLSKAKHLAQLNETLRCAQGDTLDSSGSSIGSKINLIVFVIDRPAQQFARIRDAIDRHHDAHFTQAIDRDTQRLAERFIIKQGWNAGSFQTAFHGFRLQHALRTIDNFQACASSVRRSKERHRSSNIQHPTSNF